MGRAVNVAGVAIAVAAAAALYNLKLEASEAVERVAVLETEIRRERDAIAALKAEWAELNRPERLKRLAERHLAIAPSDTRQIVRPQDVPARPDHPIGGLAGASPPAAVR